MSVMAALTGATAGAGMGYVLQRGQLCFHATFGGVLRGRFLLSRAWLLGVAIASVGLSVLFLTGPGGRLNQGLPFVPVANIVGGIVIGIGMAVARTCVSGLFYKLGAGMLGCLVGLAGWAGGELVARRIHLPGPTLLGGGPGATIPAVVGLPRLWFAVAFLTVTVVVLRVWTIAERPRRAGQWDWPAAGLSLGLVTVIGWALAGVGGSTFGPSSVGAATSVVTGSPDWWLVCFLLGIVAGSALASRVGSGFAVRGERRVRYVQLAAGGFLLGAGGWIAGGCNLGHGLSGVAQLNVSSWVVVVAITAGIGLARLLRASLRRLAAGARLVTGPATDQPASG